MTGRRRATYAAVHEINDRFHVTLYEACGNPYLVRKLADCMSLSLPMRAKNLANAEGLRLSISQHEVMIELLRGCDRWALAQLGVDHRQASKADCLARVERKTRPGDVALRQRRSG